MGIIPEVKIEEENDLLYLVIKVEQYPMPISYQGKFYLTVSTIRNTKKTIQYK